MPALPGRPGLADRQQPLDRPPGARHDLAVDRHDAGGGEGARAAAGFVACLEDRPVGSVRLWPIEVGGVPCLFLGPIAVERSERSEGLGAALVQACIDHAHQTDAAGLLLVGDAPYFGRFGFARIKGVSLPGPVDPVRLLWLPMERETVAGSVTIR